MGVEVRDPNGLQIQHQLRKVGATFYFVGSEVNLVKGEHIFATIFFLLPNLA